VRTMLPEASRFARSALSFSTARTVSWRRLFFAARQQPPWNATACQQRSFNGLPAVTPGETVVPGFISNGPSTLTESSLQSEPLVDNTSSTMATMQDAIEVLRHQAASGEVKLEEVQPVAERALHFAQDATLEQLAELAEAFVLVQLRVPLRNMMVPVSAKLREQPETSTALSSVVRLMRATGQGSLFFIDLFEFCSTRTQALQLPDLATYIYEGGRHGLRCRHFMDAVVPLLSKEVTRMTIADIMRAWQGLVRFSYERKDFFKAALPKVRPQLASLTTPHLLLVMRVARDLKQFREFIDLHAACCTELMLKIASLTANEAAQCLAQCSKDTRYRAQAQGLARTVEQHWVQTEDLSSLRVVEVVDGLDSFASWGMKSLPVLARLDNILVERQVELKYTGNVSLWTTAVQAFARMNYDAKWPLVAVEFARDRMFLDRISFFQQTALVSSFGRLRQFDETVYNNIAELLLSDFSLFKQPTDLAPVLWSYANANFVHERLFDGAYDLMIGWLESEELNLEKTSTQVAIIQICWSFVVAGYHQRYQSFAAFLDYALFTGHDKLRMVHVRRLVQLCDAVLQEAPELRDLCQQPERVNMVCSDQRVRTIVGSDPVSEDRLLRELRDTLQDMGWLYEAYCMPDDTSASYVDLSLQRHLNQKVGLLVAGRFEHLAVGLPGEPHGPREAGSFALKRRLLQSRGWQTGVVDRSSWTALTTKEQRRNYLEQVVQQSFNGPAM